MNREAAALGVPVYSIFRGRIGAVDRHLKAEGRLVLIENVSEVDGKIHFRPMPKAPSETFARNGTLDQVVSHVEQILKCYLKE